MEVRDRVNNLSAVALQRAAADQIRRVEVHRRPPLSLGVPRHCTEESRAHSAISKCPRIPPRPSRGLLTTSRRRRKRSLTVGVEEHLTALAEALAQGVDRRRRRCVLLLELRHGRHRCRRAASLLRRELARDGQGCAGIYLPGREHGERGRCGSNEYGRAPGAPEGRRGREGKRRRRRWQRRRETDKRNAMGRVGSSRAREVGV
jgi:hypothetical protein